ncbi:MAG: outer membrane protein assembly factor BamA [Candidatus Omnitrophica bacterium CG1_02_49_10]|nr:MAG: outer membrane protein assembly factor BamA [Candidatus Omnitrophica bacterium CG1_02_49_10]
MKRLVSGIVAVVFIFAGTCLFAQENEQDSKRMVVTSVDLEGNKAVSSTTVLSKVKTKRGMRFSQNILNEDIKRLYATGYFTDVTVDLKDDNDGVRVLFVFKEKPLVKKIVITGNKIFRLNKIKALISAKENAMLDRRQLKADTEAVEKFYFNKGYTSTKADYDVKTDESLNEAEVSIWIDEGKKLRIKRIFIEGNRTFGDKAISKMMATRRPSFMGIFKKSAFDEETLKDDVDRLKAFYNHEGFLDAKVDYELKYFEKKKRIYVTVSIDEGKRYYIGAIALNGNKIFSSADIEKSLDIKRGDVFNREGAGRNALNIQKFYYDRGYVSAEVIPSTVFDRNGDSMSIAYAIKENELAYLNKVDIIGNTRTKDVIIRREMRIAPGEKFDGEKLRRSKERLYNLGFFEEVTYDTRSTDKPDKKDLVVSVKETKTGEFSFGGGFSSVDKMLGFVEIKQRNFDILGWPTFTGAGQDLTLRGEFGSINKNYRLAFTDPWVFGYPYLFGFDLFQLTRERSTDVGYAYDEGRAGSILRVGKEYTDYFRADTYYRFEQIDISSVSENASSALKAEEGNNTISSLKLQLTRDTRDNVYTPSKGYILSGIAEGAGSMLGGDKDFYRYIGSGNIYFDMHSKNVLELKLKAGIVEEYGDSSSVPIYERFFAGGANTIRGYRERRVGPTDPASGDPVGGGALLIGGAEYTVPLLQSFKGAVFYDFGEVWSTTGDFLKGDIKNSAGLGVRIKTPIGPVKLDYGVPINPDNGKSRSGRFHFNMTRGF